MYNLRQIHGTLKGRVGEAIFLSMYKHAHPTKFDTHHWMQKLPFTVPDAMLSFLKDFWSTIDGFEFITKNGKVSNLKIYEIKTVNHYTAKGINFGKKSVLTHHVAKCYRLALQNGFEVRSISVILFDRWNFDVVEAPYNEKFYTLHDGNPTYSKAVLPT